MAQVRRENTAAAPKMRWVLLLVACGLLCAVAWLARSYWLGTRPPAAPVVQEESTAGFDYVGSETCAACHRSEYETYRQTAHSQAFGRVDPDQEPPDGGYHHGPSARDYEVFRQSGQLVHRESLRDPQGATLAEVEHPLQWLVGSGRHSRTYLIEADGFLAESPVTWYASRQAWAMSPGYDGPMHKGFERPADWGCLYCHVGRAEPVDGAYHRLQVHEPAIGCERCHGPGAAHVAKHRQGSKIQDGSPDGVVQPMSLTRERQEDICAQCHLRGEATVTLSGRSLDDFRPGMRLADVRLDYRLQTPGDSMKVVGHIEQMRLSACYQKTTSLTCTTCHSMHAPLAPDETLRHYRQRCLDCHTEQACGLDMAERRKRNAQDSCVACHMPQVETDIPHIAFTHHRIGLHQPAASGPAADDPAQGQELGELVPYADVSHLSRREQERGLGLAYMEAQGKAPSPSASKAYVQRARQLLESALAHGAHDGEVAAALAAIYWFDDSARAFEMAQAALADPQVSTASRVNAMFIAGDVLMQSGRSDAAVGLLSELTRLRRIAEDHLLLAGCQANMGRFEEAEKSAHRALAIDPFRPDAYELLAKLAERRSDLAAAKSYRSKARQIEDAVGAR